MGARTQPLLSCITIAKMNRASMPVDAATDLMLEERSEISWSLLLGTFHCVQELFRMALLSLNLCTASDFERKQ